MRLAVNGTTLFFDVDGAVTVPSGPSMHDKPTLLLLHGGPGFDHAYFKPAMEGMTDVAQIVYLDQRSQGRSERAPIQTCTIEQMADDAAALCQSLGINRPIVLGHSYGGFVALHMALRHPEAVGAMILVDTAAATADMDGAIERLRATAGAEVSAAALPVFAGVAGEEEMAAFERLVGPQYVHDPCTLPAVMAAWGRSSFNQEVASNYFANLAARYDVRLGLASIRVPTLVVVGEHDWLITPDAGNVIAKGIPGAELVAIEAGHFPFIERPVDFTASVIAFLRHSGLIPAPAVAPSSQ